MSDATLLEASKDMTNSSTISEPNVSERGLFDEPISPEDMRLLRKHVINLNQGKLSGGGLFDNTESDVEAIFRSHLPEFVATAGGNLKLVFYAHGGLVNEKAALTKALTHIKWWNDNNQRPEGRGIYPIYFVWETGLFETLGQMFSRIVGRKREIGARDLADITTDPAVEIAARFFQGEQIWSAMKFSALSASQNDGGATFAARELRAFLDAHAGLNVELHAIGHSAGSIFHAYFVPKAVQIAGRPFNRGYFMAPAIRADTFHTELAPHLGPGNGLEELLLFTMSKDFERADNCAGVYRKSLLYLIYHALENDAKTPILGLEETLRSDRELAQKFGLRVGPNPPAGRVFWSPTPRSAPPDSATRSLSHGGFDDDAPTMESILRRISNNPNGAIVPYPVTRAVGEIDPFKPADAPPELALLLGGGPTLLTTSRSTSSGGGRRRALCVGIDSYPSPNELGGCVADANLWAEVFSELGFASPHLLLNERATQGVILEELRRLIQDSREGDVVAFQFSGHGAQVADLDSDEDEEFDEVLCPFDFDEGHLIIDDDLSQIMAQIAPGVSVTLFMDCCHSGTNTRFAVGLPLSRGKNEKRRFMKLSAEVSSLHRHNRSRVARTRSASRRRTAEEMREVLFSACMPHEVALESDGHGHFTTHATALLRADGASLSNEAFQQGLLTRFGTARRQTPLLDCCTDARSGLLFGFSTVGDSRPATASSDKPLELAGSSKGQAKAIGAALRALADAVEGK